jgi:hypothetical protein
MRRIIRIFDGFIRGRLGVFEFPEDPQGVLRGQFDRAHHDLAIRNHRIVAGTPVFHIHIWNEQIPPIPKKGADLAWAVRMNRLLVSSFRMLARHLKTDPAYVNVQALGGVSVIATDDSGGIAGLFSRLGFSVLPYHNPLGRFGEFWENFYSWWILWTFNPASLRGRSLFKLRRREIWITREDFLLRHG